MSNAMFYIGDAIHVAAECGVKLSSICRVAFEPQDEQALCSNEALSFEQLDSCWISRGIGLCMILNINQGNLSIDRADWLASIQSLKDNLNHAELWQQLCLKVEPVDHENVNLADRALELRLKYDDLAPFEAGSHFPGQPETVQRALPPEGVSTIALASVELKFDFSSRRSRAPKRARTESLGGRSEDKTLLEESSQQCSDSGEDLFEEETYGLGHSASVTASHSSPSQGSNSQAASSSSMSTQDFSTKGQLGDDSTVRLKERKPFGADAMTKLVDSALRTFIYPARTPLPTGVVGRAKRVDQGLSRVAPALFCPGYYYAISERAKLIPNIASSMIAIASRATTPSLQSTLRQLMGQSLSGSQQLSSDNNSGYALTVKNLSALSKGIQTRLWKSLQRELYSDRVIRKLKFITHSDVPTGNEKDDFPLLDSGYEKENNEISCSQNTQNLSQAQKQRTRDLEYLMYDDEAHSSDFEWLDEADEDDMELLELSYEEANLEIDDIGI